MEIRIFKFGGASVNNAEGFRNVARILHSERTGPLMIILSALGKTTNGLEEVLNHYMANDPVAVVESFRKVWENHENILRELFPDPSHPVYGEMHSLFDQLRGYIRKGHLYSAERPPYDFEYDQMVSFGEMFSTTMLNHVLIDNGLNCRLFDVRELIKTDSTHRDATVNWDMTSQLINQSVKDYFSSDQETAKIALTQGFLGSDPSGNTTTLGREGSDYSAAIFAHTLGAREVTIWKDVPGVMNADPKWRPEAAVLEVLSYREAIELAYYGASIIHPKTIKPLENAGITLKVRSFRNPDLPGTIIENLSEWTIETPIFIRKQNQVLISISPRDFSFIVEENLSEIFRILAEHRIKVNMMQHSAISFSICVDDDHRKVPQLLIQLRAKYQIRYNSALELYTIRHYQPDTLNDLTKGRNILMEQKSRHTLQVVLQ